MVMERETFILFFALVAVKMQYVYIMLETYSVPIINMMASA